MIHFDQQKLCACYVHQRIKAKVRVYAIAIFISGAAGLMAESGIVEYFDGEVTVIREGDEFFVDFGEVLEPGDLIKTGIGSTAVIRLNERAQVKLRGSTHLWIDSVAREAATVSLDSGGVFARVVRVAGAVTGISDFQVKTPSVVAGVRGTEFFVAYGRTIEEEPDLWLCVNEGSVEVAVPATGQRVTVEEGEGINILAGIRATEPKLYEWTTELNWNFDPDAGNVTDETDLDGAYADLLGQDYD